MIHHCKRKECPVYSEFHGILHHGILGIGILESRERNSWKVWKSKEIQNRNDFANIKRG
jgi:hypothetical protein